MKLYLNPPEWTSGDIERLRDFLGNSTGEALLARLQWMRPDFDVAGDATQRLVTAGRVEGYEECVADIVALTFPVQDELAKIPNPEYPPLDLEPAWEQSPNS